MRKRYNKKIWEQNMSENKVIELLKAETHSIVSNQTTDSEQFTTAKSAPADSADSRSVISK